jgi:hypothetical protein
MSVSQRVSVVSEIVSDGLVLATAQLSTGVGEFGDTYSGSDMLGCIGDMLVGQAQAFIGPEGEAHRARLVQRQLDDLNAQVRALVITIFGSRMAEATAKELSAEIDARMAAL